MDFDTSKTVNCFVVCPVFIVCLGEYHFLSGPSHKVAPHPSIWGWKQFWFRKLCVFFWRRDCRGNPGTCNPKCNITSSELLTIHVNSNLNLCIETCNIEILWIVSTFSILQVALLVHFLVLIYELHNCRLWEQGRLFQHMGTKLQKLTCYQFALFVSQKLKLSLTCFGPYVWPRCTGWLSVLRSLCNNI
jgi:hypothetical protein